MKVGKEKGLKNLAYRYTVQCQPEECDKCRLGKPHKKHTKRVHKSAGTTKKGEAEPLAFKEQEEAIERGKGTYVPTVKEAREAWLKVNATEVGIGHWNNVNKWDPHGLEDFKIDKLTTEVVQLARGKHRDGQGRISAKRADESVSGWMRILNLLVGFCIKRGNILKKPYDIAIPKAQKKPKKILPLAKVASWLAAVDAHARNPQVGTAARLMIGLGLRESEALGARWEFVDWEARTYTPGRIVAGQFVTKGGEADALDMPGYLYDHLLALRGDGPRLGLILPWKKLDNDGNEYEVPHPSTFTRASMRAANVDVKTPGVTAHRVRGTWITQHARTGLPPAELQAMARHSDLETTMGYYETSSELRKKAQDDLASKMGLA